jgi:hypothetical protein
MPDIVDPISLMIGVIVILSGVLLGVLRLVRLEGASLSRRDSLVGHEDLRHHLRLYRGGGGQLHRTSKFKRHDGGSREETHFAERSK